MRKMLLTNQTQPVTPQDQFARTDQKAAAPPGITRPHSYPIGCCQFEFQWHTDTKRREEVQLKMTYMNNQLDWL